MQNSILSPTIITAHHFVPGTQQQQLPGCQWRQNDRSQCRLPSSVSPVAPSGARTPAAAFVVSAFFGGSKTPPIKSAGKGCFSCLGKGAVDCAGCKGTGKNKKNGNMFERWKCYDCQGFGMVGCPKCGTGGLTPEQRGER